MLAGAKCSLQPHLGFRHLLLLDLTQTIMRSSPSMSSGKVMSLAAGSGITLVERAGAMNGYDWFNFVQVALRNTGRYPHPECP